MNLDPVFLIPKGVFFLILAIIFTLVFVVIFHQISHLSSRLCIYHKKESFWQRMEKLFFVNLKLSSAFFLVIYVILQKDLNLETAFAVSAGISFVVLTSSRIMALTTLGCPEESSAKKENERVASNIYSIITAALVVSTSILVYNLLFNSNAMLEFGKTNITELFVLLLLFAANAIAMTFIQSISCYFLKVPKNLQTQ